MNEAAYRQAEMKLWDHFRRQPAERFIPLRFARTRIRIQEIGEGPAVLFVHGGPNSGSTWAPLLEHLHGFRCLLVDRPGTGLSEPFAVTADNLPEFGASFVRDILNELELQDAHVVASSFGGHVALRSAAAAPERIRRMVQMACPALAPGEQVPRFMRLMTSSLFRRILNVLPPNPTANRMIMRQLGHAASLRAGKFPEAFLDWYLALQRFTTTNRNEGEMIAQAMAARSTLELSDRILRDVHVPTLFLWGEHDTFGGLDVARHVVNQMPDARMEVMPEAGHLPWLDDPEHAARATASFLRAETAQRVPNGTHREPSA